MKKVLRNDNWNIKKEKEDLLPFGFGGSEKYAVVLKILKLAGLPEKWGWCPVCNGEEIDPSVKEKYDNWKSYEPPTGDGYQCWETTSEGSPISPVFKTLDELCEWLANNSSGVSKRMNKKDWINAMKDPAPCVNLQTKELVTCGKNE